ncbi:hypothetical protein [Spirochaeta isovalerica]|uniref:Uncharacterized protein n=1 Tax=Spirochaeta isovalerica TaxID=150 RepID=A0A841RI13_9SPIO|nr:hypothetical protein [Spirochaeta isovalerica]MBB6482399.1 hypothetical protein [Spirochaeta isovalerica]
MKKIVLGLIVSTLVFGLAAQSRPFEVSKNSYDPFIAQKGGFESLFVNPAAMAGETDIFTWDIEGGMQGKKSTFDTIQLMMNNSELLSGESTAAELTPADAEQIMDLLAENMTDQTVQDLLASTSLDGSITTPEELIAYLENNEISETDATQIAQNIENDPAILEDAVNGLIGELKVNVEFTTKMGTLIKGFGIGIYGNAYSVLDAGQMGFDTLIAETGVKAGYGFNIGPFGIGVSGDFAMIGDFTGDGQGIALADIGGIMNHTMYYGYAWGIDAGMTFDILPSLTVGAVMTDIIGTYNYVGITTLENMMSGATPAKLSYDYKFDLDLDMGITWSPKIGSGKLLNFSFSADYYDFIGMFRTPPQNFQDVVDHMRFGAHMQLLSFINARAQYYQEYFTVGAGVDLLFLEVYGEFQFKQTFDDIGAAALVKLHF